jgi:isopenicillin N synthase-like dioxygenase
MVPNIDISALDSVTDRAETRAQIHQACRESGFFLISGHGLEANIDDVFEATRWFFDLPMERKLALSRSEENSRGYYDRELTKNTRDMKEVFDCGALEYPELPASHESNRTQDGWNQWPQGQGSQEFIGLMSHWLHACHGVALRLLRALTENLGADSESLLADFVPRHSSFLRLNHYPLTDPHPDAGRPGRAADTGHMGVHHHTDAGALTLLLQDMVGGLQIRHQGRWMDVQPVPGTLVVNIGDIVQVWSNDLYPAPLHRVVASTGRNRYSLPYFFNPVYEANYAPLPEATGADNPPRYRPIHWGHFRHQRQHGDYGDYGNEIQISDFRAT